MVDCLQVAAWINALGWGTLRAGFLANNISGEALLMVDNHMLKDVGVNALGDRLLLLRARDMLLAEQAKKGRRCEMRRLPLTHTEGFRHPDHDRSTDGVLGRR